MKDEKKMRLAIDGSSIFAGGSIVHLREILNRFEPGIHGFSQITVWLPSKTVAVFDPKPGVKLIGIPAFNKLWTRSFGRKRILSEVGRHDKVVVLGGLALDTKIPQVVMCQNLQPFMQEMSQGESLLSRIRLKLLRKGLLRSFKLASKIIYISQFSREVVESFLPVAVHSRGVVQAHGCGEEYFSFRAGKPSPTNDKPIEIYYAAIVAPYKNQIQAIEALSLLRRQGYNLHFTIVGVYRGAYGRKMLQLIKEVDPNSDWITVTGRIDHESVIDIMKQSDIALFLSSCEAFGMSLTEAMAAGLPTVVSKLRPMTDNIGEFAGALVNPKSVDSIANGLVEVIENWELSNEKAVAARRRAREFNWAVVADDFFRTAADANIEEQL